MAKVIRVKAVATVTGGRFCRAGRCFGTVFTTLREDELTAEQLAALQAEPLLVVEIADALEPTKPQAKAEADKAAKPADQAPAGGQGEAKPADQSKQAAKPAAKPGNKEGGK
jgi:hypothetical protein